MKITITAIAISLTLVTLALGSGLSDLLVKNSATESATEIDELVDYLKTLERENNIDYVNVEAITAYIPPMCYTKTKDSAGVVHNPCYSCHTQGKKPNYINDLRLQAFYDFPVHGFENKWSNLFTDNTQAVESITDEAIVKYIRGDNYFTSSGEIYLAQKLPASWPGYRPDCYFNFNSEGFDINPKTGERTGWRAFRYYPFLGTFWPTNGSTDDVLIRLPETFMKDVYGLFSIEIYKVNLALIESAIKQKDITTEPLDEMLAGYDLDANGEINTATTVKYLWPQKDINYVGMAGELQRKGELHAAGGLFPEGTEFLHTVRYIDFDESGNATLTPRMKEVRYAKKVEWLTYSDIQTIAYAEAKDMAEGGELYPETFYGNFASGYYTPTGWVFQGFIEDKNGALRPQTNEETVFCMGCHSGVGVITDGIFSFARKFEGGDSQKPDYGYAHWSQKGIKGLPDPLVDYKSHGNQYEYSFYLSNNHAGDEFRENTEIMDKFFKGDGSLKEDMVAALRSDVSLLLFPSAARAMKLNKAYSLIVQRQSFIKGRDAIITPPANIHKELKEDEKTGITSYVY